MLELYYSPYCPFCIKVFNAMKNIDVSVELKNIDENQDAARKLVEVGGKRQVPCLFIDGKPMYESDDIIAYLRSL